MRVSIIVPVLNDAASLASQDDALRALSRQGHQIIVVDGYSRDQSLAVARSTGAEVLQSGPGRARQMNAGAAAADGDVLLFLHADTRLGPGCMEALGGASQRRGDSLWGRFDVHLDGTHRFYRLIEWMMNLRSRITRVATGDQALFASRVLFRRAGGFPEIPLMEDVALSKSLRRLARPECLKARVRVSTRRWARHGIFSTTLLMWRLRLRYFLGADPAKLARAYYGPGPEPGP